LKCKLVKKAWRAMLLEDIQLSLLNVATLTLVIEQVLALPKEKGIQVFTMLWDWRTNRNKSNAGELPRSTEQVCHIIHKHMLFMPGVTGRESGMPREDNVNHPKPVWLKPKENFTKVNFDAGNHKTTGEGSWGFVARTDEGEFIADFEFNFYPRTCNRVAHELAQAGFRSEVECVGWAESSPSFVKDLLASESAKPLLSPYFGLMKRWAVIKMGLEIYVQYIAGSALRVDLG
jgi:hypothetical protein